MCDVLLDQKGGWRGSGADLTRDADRRSPLNPQESLGRLTLRNRVRERLGIFTQAFDAAQLTPNLVYLFLARLP